MFDEPIRIGLIRFADLYDHKHKQNKRYKTTDAQSRSGNNISSNNSNNHNNINNIDGSDIESYNRHSTTTSIDSSVSGQRHNSDLLEAAAGFGYSGNNQLDERQKGKERAKGNGKRKRKRRRRELESGQQKSGASTEHWWINKQNNKEAFQFDLDHQPILVIYTTTTTTTASDSRPAS